MNLVFRIKFSNQFESIQLGFLYAVCTSKNWIKKYL